MTDGLIPFMRQIFAARNYVGIEIEMNQGILRRKGARRDRYVDLVIASFTELLDWAS